jgi:hypothetical protein
LSLHTVSASRQLALIPAGQFRHGRLLAADVDELPGLRRRSVNVRVRALTTAVGLVLFGVPIALAAFLYRSGCSLIVRQRSLGRTRYVSPHSVVNV